VLQRGFVLFIALTAVVAMTDTKVCEAMRKYLDEKCRDHTSEVCKDLAVPVDKHCAWPLSRHSFSSKGWHCEGLRVLAKKPSIQRKLDENCPSPSLEEAQQVQEATSLLQVGYDGFDSGHCPSPTPLPSPTDTESPTENATEPTPSPTDTPSPTENPTEHTADPAACEDIKSNCSEDWKCNEDQTWWSQQCRKTCNLCETETQELGAAVSAASVMTETPIQLAESSIQVYEEKTDGTMNKGNIDIKPGERYEEDGSYAGVKVTMERYAAEGQFENKGIGDNDRYGGFFIQFDAIGEFTATKMKLTAPNLCDGLSNSQYNAFLIQTQSTDGTWTNYPSGADMSFKIAANTIPSGNVTTKELLFNPPLTGSTMRIGMKCYQLSGENSKDKQLNKAARTAIEENFDAHAWKISVLTELGEFGWDDNAKQSLAESLGSGTSINCTAIMQDCTLMNKFKSWATESSGRFLQDPAPGKDPVLVTVGSTTYNVTASKKKLPQAGEGTVEKRMLCITPPSPAQQECCVSKGLIMEDGIDTVAQAMATARLQNF